MCAGAIAVAEHEPSIGQCDDWYTPPEIFDALGLTFDLDPCSPGPSHWVPARQVFTKQEDGLCAALVRPGVHESTIRRAEWPRPLAAQVS
jgi:hypothetical protein